MYYPDLAVSKFMEKSIDLKRVNCYFSGNKRKHPIKRCSWEGNGRATGVQLLYQVSEEPFTGRD